MTRINLSNFLTDIPYRNVGAAMSKTRSGIGYDKVLLSREILIEATKDRLRERSEPPTLAFDIVNKASRGDPLYDYEWAFPPYSEEAVQSALIRNGLFVENSKGRFDTTEISESLVARNNPIDYRKCNELLTSVVKQAITYNESEGPLSYISEIILYGELLNQNDAVSDINLMCTLEVRVPTNSRYDNEIYDSMVMKRYKFFHNITRKKYDPNIFKPYLEEEGIRRIRALSRRIIIDRVDEPFTKGLSIYRFVSPQYKFMEDTRRAEYENRQAKRNLDALELPKNISLTQPLRLASGLSRVGVR